MDVVGESHVPGNFNPTGKNHRLPLHVSLGGPQSGSGNFGADGNLLAIPRFELRLVQPAAWPLYHVHNLASQKVCQYVC